MILLAIWHGLGYIYAWPVGCFNVLFGMHVLCFNAAQYGLCVNIWDVFLFLPDALNFSLEHQSICSILFSVQFSILFIISLLWFNLVCYGLDLSCDVQLFAEIGSWTSFCACKSCVAVYPTLSIYPLNVSNYSCWYHDGSCEWNRAPLTI